MTRAHVIVTALVTLAGCSGGTAATPEHLAAPGVFPDAPCGGAPAAARGPWRHLRSRAIALLTPHHRGVDLIAAADAPQRIEAEVHFGGLTDKALEGEDVELFACRDGAWTTLGRATSDSDGRVHLDLTAAQRLQVGLHDLYVSVVGDRSGAPFLGLVAPAGTPLVISDVDGTLTASENAFPKSLLSHAVVDAQPGAAAALAAFVTRGYQPVYVTSRGRRFTDATRRWLADAGLPRGPLRLASALVTLPGDETVELKSELLDGLLATHLTVAVGLGNRASDVAAYRHAGLPAARILIKLPEFADEVTPHLTAGEATAVTRYTDLAAGLDAVLGPRR